MNWIAIISLVLLSLAAAWAGWLAWRLRDVRLVFLSVMLGLMALCRFVGIAEGSGPSKPLMLLEDWIVLFTSLLAVVAVFYLGRMLDDRGAAAARLSLLTDVVRDSIAPVLITDADLSPPGPRIIYVNDAMCALCGYSRQELIGQSPRILQGPMTDPSMLAKLRSELSSGRPFVGTAVNYKKDGTIYWVNWMISPVRDRRGRLTSFFSLQQDVTRTHNAEGARHRSEALAKSVLDSLEAHICLVDREGKILAVNRSWESFFHSNDSVGNRTCGSGSNYFEVCKRAADAGEQDAAQCLDGMRSVLDGRVPQFDFEYPCHSATARRWYLMRVVPMGDGTGGLVVSHIDVTSARLTEENLRAQEQRYRLIVETAAEGIWLVDKDWRTSYVNRRMAEMLETTPEEMLGRHVREFMGDEEQALIGPLMSAREQGIADQHDFRFRTRTGRGLWAMISTNPVHDAGGRFAGALAMVSDITDRKKAEEELRAALQKLNFHVDNSPLGVIEWDRDFRVSFWSSGAERIFGWKSNEVLGRHPRDWPIIHPEDSVRVDEVMRRLSTGEEQRNLCLNRNLTKAGDVRWCQWYNSVLLDENGHMRSLFSLAEDVTERHRADERQRLLMLELDHRVKNNLATVLGIGEQTIAASRSLEEFSDAFRGRIEALARAHGLLARASWEGIDLRELAERVLEPYLFSNDPKIKIQGAPVRLAASQGSTLALMFHELMTNASKYGSLSRAEGHVRLAWELIPSEKCSIVRIDWSEVGGPPVVPPSRTGFGTPFIRTAIAYELHGEAEVDYHATGLRCRVSFPLALSNGASLPR